MVAKAKAKSTDERNAHAARLARVLAGNLTMWAEWLETGAAPEQASANRERILAMTRIARGLAPDLEGRQAKMLVLHWIAKAAKSVHAASAEHVGICSRWVVSAIRDPYPEIAGKLSTPEKQTELGDVIVAWNRRAAKLTIGKWERVAALFAGVFPPSEPGSLQNDWTKWQKGSLRRFEGHT